MKPFPHDEWIKGVCRIGQGAACCRYLTMSPTGWDCEKKTQLGLVLDARVARGEMTARGDNCKGAQQ
jgi:hypothetical protein